MSSLTLSQLISLSFSLPVSFLTKVGEGGWRGGEGGPEGGEKEGEEEEREGEGRGREEEAKKERARLMAQGSVGRKGFLWVGGSRDVSLAGGFGRRRTRGTGASEA